MKKNILFLFLLLALFLWSQFGIADSTTAGIVFTLIMIVWGFFVLVIGGNSLVEWSHSLALHYNIPPLIVGMTILAIGTSMPELFVNMIAALRGETGLLLANIIGSNISNLLLIGWIAAIIAPLMVKPSTLYKEIPISFGGALILLYMITNDMFFSGMPNTVSRVEWFFLLFLFILFLIQLLKKWAISDEVGDAPDHSLIASMWLIILWWAWLYLWWDALVTYSIVLAKLFDVSAVLIGASIVAVGTSIPELATSVIAALKKHTDLAIGNIIGSNIFNILWVTGITSIIKPIAVDGPISTDISILLVATLLLFVIVYSRKDRTIVKTAGFCMVALYLCYLIFLIHRW